MTNIEDGLKELFSFRRNISDSYRSLQDSYRSQRHTPHTNVVIEDAYNKLYGTAELQYVDSKGMVIYEYAVDKEIRTSGPKLKEPFESLQDCELHYYGLKLSTLAYLFSGRVYKLVIRDTWNDKSIPVRYNRSMAEKFIMHLTKPKITYVGEIEPEKTEEQYSIFK